MGTTADLHESLSRLPYLECGHRASFMLVRILAAIGDTVVVSHSSGGCDADWIAANQHYRSLLKKKGLPVRNARFVSTNLTETDLIFGADGKLEQAVKKAVDIYHPQAVFVRTKCCTPGRSPGEMMDVIKQIQKKYAIPVLLARCDFISGLPTKRRRVYKGRRSSWKILVGNSFQKKEPFYNLVNFTDDDSFSELVSDMGVRWNHLSYCSSFASFDKAARADATIHFSPVEFGEYLGKMLFLHHGVAYHRIPPPYGIRATDEALSAIGEIVGREAEFRRLLFVLKTKYGPLVEKVRTELRGIRCLPILAGDGENEASMLAMLEDLGVDVVGRKEAGRRYDTVLGEKRRVSSFYGEGGLDFGSHAGYKLLSFIRDQHPDVLLVHHTGITPWSVEMGIPTIEFREMKGAFSLYGYRGLLRLGRKILDTFSNSAFLTHLSGKACPSHSRWWLKQSLVREVSSP